MDLSGNDTFDLSGTSLGHQAYLQVEALLESNANNDATSVVGSLSLYYQEIPDTTAPLYFPVRWSATDDSSGIAYYDVQYQKNGGNWTAWLSQTTASEVYFPGEADQSYTFRMQATDVANNTSDWSSASDAVTAQAVTRYYHHGNSRVAFKRGSTLYYLHGDHLGSTSLTTDNAGSLLSEQRYLPYGQARLAGQPFATDIGFTGQRNEAGFGLMDYNARYYSPVLGRFISPDTIVPQPGNPQSWNRYGYVDNNPMTYVDPTGHCKGLSGKVFDVCVAAVVGVADAVHSTNAWVADNRETLVKTQAAGVDVLPFVGDAKGLAEVFTGNDLMTGEDLGNWRWAGLVFLSELRLLRHGDDVADAARIAGRHLDEAGDFAGNFFSKYDQGTVFSGAFDTTTRNFALRPSTENMDLALDSANEWVYRRGGHGKVANDLSDNWDNIYGFTVKYDANGQLSVPSWSSGTLNTASKGGRNRQPPDHIKQQILDSLREQTGWDVAAPN